jgi:hypothetical protein
LAKNKYRSKFESNVATSLSKRGIDFQYEVKKFPFVQPAVKRNYTPDFFISETDLFVECKGKLTSDERKKLLWWRAEHPDVPFVILFMRGRNPIRKGSRTTYMDWAAENGFEAFDYESQLDAFSKRIKKSK